MFGKNVDRFRRIVIVAAVVIRSIGAIYKYLFGLVAAK